LKHLGISSKKKRKNKNILVYLAKKRESWNILVYLAIKKRKSWNILVYRSKMFLYIKVEMSWLKHLIPSEKIRWSEKNIIRWSILYLAKQIEDEIFGPGCSKQWINHLSSGQLLSTG
jgi:hypothetical protein